MNTLNPIAKAHVEHGNGAKSNVVKSKLSLKSAVNLMRFILSSSAMPYRHFTQLKRSH